MTVDEFIRNCEKLSRTEVRTFLQEHAKIDLPSSALGRAFEKLYIEKGITATDVPLSELIELHHSFTLGNGGGWCRSDDGCYLGKKFIVRKQKENGRITSVSVAGYKIRNGLPKTKRISIELLEELKDASESYRTLAGALLISTELDEDVREDAEQVKTKYEMNMLELIDVITQNV